MRLRLATPTEVMVDERVGKIVAESPQGSFCLLPRHIDFTTALAPGLLWFVRGSGDRTGVLEDQEEEVFLAVDHGILVKQGRDVRVSTRRAIPGPDLGLLRRKVREEFEALDEQELQARSALARLESRFLHRFLEIGEPRHV